MTRKLGRVASRQDPRSLRLSAAGRRFEYDRHARALDVFGCTPSEAAIDVLFRVGFARVTQHPHAAEKFVGCACLTRRCT